MTHYFVSTVYLFPIYFHIYCGVAYGSTYLSIQACVKILFHHPHQQYKIPLIHISTPKYHALAVKLQITIIYAQNTQGHSHGRSYQYPREKSPVSPFPGPGWEDSGPIFRLDKPGDIGETNQAPGVGNQFDHIIGNVPIIWTHGPGI
jgi:hypothetical protein